MNLNEQLRQAYESGRRQGLNELSLDNSGSGAVGSGSWPGGNKPPTNPTAPSRPPTGGVYPTPAPDHWPSYWPWGSIWNNLYFDFSTLQLPYNPEFPYMQVSWSGEIGGPWTCQFPEFGGTLEFVWVDGNWASTYTQY
jgi:hypothetical protein